MWFPSPFKTLRYHEAVLAACVSLALAAGCGKPESRITVAATQPSAALSGSLFDPDVPLKYVLYPGDLVLVRYPTDATLDQQVRIRSDGMISLPYVGDVQAAQRSPAEIAADLNKKYEGVLKKADVTVIVIEEAGRRIYLGGQIHGPGALPLRANQTLTQAIFEAGGTTPQAYAEQIIVIRSRPGAGTQVLKADLTKILGGREPDVRLEPFDVIHVPDTVITRVDQVVEQYVNLIIPRSVSFPFFTQLKAQPLRVIDNDSNNNFPQVQITR